MGKIDLLIVEDNPGDAVLIQEYLVGDPISNFNFSVVEKLSEAIDHISVYNYDAIILDLNLPDSNGLETLQSIVDQKISSAILVLTGLDDEELGIEAVKRGAQNYLVKNKIDGAFLKRAIRFSLSRKQDQNKLQHLNRLLSAIRSVNQLIIRETESKNLIDKACEIVVNKSGYEHAWISLVNNHNEVTKISHSGIGEKATSIINNIKNGIFPPCFKTIKNDYKTINHYEIENCKDCPLKESCQDNSILIVPLLFKEKLSGFMGVSIPGNFANNDEEIELFQELVNDIGFALHNIQIHKNEKILFKEKIESEKKLKEKNIEISNQIEKYQVLNKQLIQKNKELLLAKEKAEESERLKSAFLANMSHEIRTPMNGILGFTNLLQISELTGSQQKEYIEIIQKSGNRMLNTVNDLIDISRIDAGQIKLVLTQVNICKELENLHKFFKPEASKKGLEFNLYCLLSEKENILETDLHKVSSIFSNLIKNSIKYTHNGSINIFCFKKNNKILFKIKDTGIGIPKNRQDAIFDRFVQADIEDTRVYEGSGLGLAISKAYAEILEGKLWLESKEGEGSTFYFSIPYRNSNDKKETVIKENIIEEKVSIRKELDILIVEDDEISSKYLSALLNGFVREMVCAKTGLEAVDICKKNPDIDLVLMDIKLPGLNGIEATRIIREFNKDVVIIAQSAYSNTEDKRIAIDVGCNDYISKPIIDDELISIIAKWVN